VFIDEGRDVRPVLLGGAHDFFKVIFSLAKKRQIVP
jgi:hypothetical protein